MAEVSLPNHDRISRRRAQGSTLFLGIALVVLFWAVDSVVDGLVFRQGDILGRLLAPEASELWTRSLVFAVVLAFGFWARSAIGERRREEKLLPNGMDSSVQHDDRLAKRQDEILALLVDARAVSESQDFRCGAQVVLSSCMRSIGAASGYVALMAEDETEYEVIALDFGEGVYTPNEPVHRPLEGLMAEVYRTGKSIYVNDFGTSVWAKALPNDHKPLENVLLAVLVSQGRTVGVLSLANKTGGFCEDDARVATAFGELAEVALKNSRVFGSLERSEERFRSVAQTASDAIVCTDSEGNIVFWNHGAETMTGYSADEIAGNPFGILIPERFRDVYRREFGAAFADGKSSLVGTTFERVCVRKNGTQFPIELSLARWKTGEGTFFTIIVRDISERKRAEAALAKTRDFYLTLFDEFPTPIWRSGTDGSADYFNRSWLALTGRTIDQEKGNGWLEALHPDDLMRWTRIYTAAFEERKPFEVEYRLRRFDGEYRWFVAVGRPFNDLDGNFAGYIGSNYDMTERKQQEEQLAYLAAHDPLTGLPNRRTLEDALERAVARARRGYPSALLFLDVDNFKVVNDTLGHSAGDRALTTLAGFLQRHLRGEDLMARMGGDEFAVLVEGTTLDEAHVIAERMRRAMEEFQLSMGGVKYNLGLSIGLVGIDGSQAPAVVLSQADAAMYKAKELGRNRVVV